jgi:hypothetical protein
MEEQDPIENKFKSTFSGFEKEPPAKVWENLHMHLHPLPHPLGFWAKILKFPKLLHLHPVFYLSFSGVAIATSITVVWFFTLGRYEVRGHAYAGGARLSSGRAELFEVKDKAMPWDSVTHFRSAIIDHFGHFQFSRVGSGKYLMRIAPDEEAEVAKSYAPCWFDGHERSDSADLVEVAKSDKNLEVRLVRKNREIPK